MISFSRLVRRNNSAISRPAPATSNSGPRAGNGSSTHAGTGERQVSIGEQIFNGVGYLAKAINGIRDALERIEQQNSVLDRNERALERVESMLEKRNDYETRMGQVYSALSTELDDSRPGRRFDEMRPILMDLIRLIDRLRDLADHASDDGQLLHGASDQALEILARQGVTNFRTSQGAPFAPETQERSGGVATSDVRLAGCVAESARDGFRLGDRLLRAESVMVWKLQETPIDLIKSQSVMDLYMAANDK